MQSSTITDPGQLYEKVTKYEKGSEEVSRFPTGDHKAARNRHGSMAKTNANNKMIYKRNVTMERSVPK